MYLLEASIDLKILRFHIEIESRGLGRLPKIPELRGSLQLSSPIDGQSLSNNIPIISNYKAQQAFISMVRCDISE